MNEYCNVYKGTLADYFYDLNDSKKARMCLRRLKDAMAQDLPVRYQDKLALAFYATE